MGTTLDKRNPKELRVGMLTEYVSRPSLREIPHRKSCSLSAPRQLSCLSIEMRKTSHHCHKSNRRRAPFFPPLLVVAPFFGRPISSLCQVLSASTGLNDNGWEGAAQLQQVSNLYSRSRLTPRLVKIFIMAHSMQNCITISSGAVIGHGMTL